MDKKQAKELVIKTARFIDDKKAEEVKVYDLCGLSSLCDYIVIGTATSTPHLDALDMDAGTELKKDGLYKNNRDGGQTTTWRVSDYGYFMTQAAREFYALDKIFSFGKEVKWQKPKKTAAKTVKKTAVKTVKKAVKKTVKAATKKTDKKTLKKAAAKTVKKSVKTAAKKTAKKTAKKSTK